MVNKIQNLRKEKDFEVTDKINIKIEENDYTSEAIQSFNEYICEEVLADSLVVVPALEGHDQIDIDTITLNIKLSN